MLQTNYESKNYKYILSSFGQNVKIVHFIGSSKPWHVKFDANGQPQPKLYEEHTYQFLQQWWHIFHANVKPALSQMVSGMTFYLQQP